MSEHTLTLSDEELGLIQEALDSYEYWEHRDALPHDSGFITIIDEQDFEAQLRGYDEAEHEAMREAWVAVREARELADKLNTMTKGEQDASALAGRAES